MKPLGIPKEGTNAKKFKGFKKDWKPGRVVILHPLRRIGRFFGKLSQQGKNDALNLAKVADRLPRFVIENQAAKLEARVKFNLLAQ